MFLNADSSQSYPFDLREAQIGAAHIVQTWSANQSLAADTTD